MQTRRGSSLSGHGSLAERSVSRTPANETFCLENHSGRETLWGTEPGGRHPSPVRRSESLSREETEREGAELTLKWNRVKQEGLSENPRALFSSKLDHQLVCSIAEVDQSVGLCLTNGMLLARHDYWEHDYWEHDYWEHDYWEHDYWEHDYWEHDYWEHDYWEHDFWEHDYWEHDYWEHDYWEHDYWEHDYWEHDFWEHDYWEHDFWEHDYWEHDYWEHDFWVT
ncbi:hypothetical protein DPEC_G00124870 [Dallia pectoralis]|uniref:Uncharacterized protein n=1 Tax=Dallia pectoralis TaxID=75939 RepID=A0ACC2GRD4_DALPE|nr:hypothetical protein DPEC_G00124870 [Dallia pectoralis]